MNRLLSLFVVLLLFGAIEADKTKDRSQLLFRFMTPLALGIACAFAVLLIIATVVICVFDLRGQSGLPKEAKEGQSLMWKPVKIKASREPLLEKSEESETQKSPSMKMADLEAEATQFSLVRGYSSRMDPQEKHNRIIEAIYQASGRDLPEMYRAKNKVALGKNENLETMVNPLEAINEDQEEDQTGIDPTQTDFTKMEHDAVKVHDLLADSTQLNTEKKKKEEEKEKKEESTKHAKEDSVSEDHDKGEEGKSEKSNKSETTKTEKEGKKEGKEENKTEKEEKKEEEGKKQTEEKKTSKEETKKEEGEKKGEEKKSEDLKKKEEK